MKNTLFIALFLALFSLGCDSDTFSPPSEESRGESPTASSTGGNSSSTTTDAGSTPVTISNGSGSGSSSNGGSSSGGTGGFATGGTTGSGGSNSGGNNSVKYQSPGGYDSYFSKINEPLDQQTSKNLPFAFKFVAVGQMPLKYTWYKEGENGRTKLGSTSTTFAKASASFADEGVYFATVEDALGNVLTSRRAKLIVNPERKRCLAGTYGPRFDNQSNTFNFRNLVPKAEMNDSGGRTFKIDNDIDGYAQTIDACPLYKGPGGTCNNGDGTMCTGLFRGNSLSCNRGKTLVQCENGSYRVLSTTCFCYEDNG